MKDFLEAIRDWASSEHVITEAIIERESTVEIYTDCVHFEDLCKLNNIDDNWHITFVEKDLEGNMCINMRRSM